MSVAYRRWELGGGAPGVGYNKKITGSPAQVHHHQYGSVDGTAVLRRQQQQQHQQQHQPHEPCNLSSFSIYMQQCPSAASAGTTAAAVAATTTGKLQVMAATHSTLSLPDHQAAAAQEKAEEVERWGMMQMGHAGMGGCGHKLPVTSTRLSSSNVPRQFCSVQGGLSLMMNPPSKGEESAAPTTAEDCTTATTTTPDALQRVYEVSHTAASRGVVGVFLPEEQCVKKKQEVLPLAASSSPSSSSSSICDGREQSSCSSQEDTSGDVEAQSAYRGPLDQMSALESSLPIKRPGLSKFFGGKSRSFSSLADVSSVSDLAKPNNPYAKRRRLGLNSPLDRHRSYPPISRASVAGISKKSSNRSSTLTVAVKLGSLTEEDKDYTAALPGSRISGTRTTPSRSFSLTDLPVVSNPSSPPSRRSFAQP